LPKDLPDWSTKVTISHEVTDSDLTTTDHKKIKGVPLKDPSVAAAVPISVENPAIAYDPTNDVFYVRTKSAALGVHVIGLPSDPARESGNLAAILTALTRVVAWASGEASSVGDTKIITCTGGKKITIVLMTLHNNSDAANTMALKFGAGGTQRFKKAVASGAGFAINMIGANWQGGTGEDFYINLTAAKAIGYDIGYYEV